jgi:photosystem II stability/assembly factor-like uncharacterized protein
MGCGDNPPGKAPFSVDQDGSAPDSKDSRIPPSTLQCGPIPPCTPARKDVPSGWEVSPPFKNISEGAQLVAHPGAADVLFATQETLWRSTDGGATWCENPEVANPARIEFSPSHPCVLYLTAPIGVLRRSTDFGATWEQRGAADFSYSVDVANPDVFYSLSGDKLNVSTDGHMTFTARTAPRDGIDIVASRERSQRLYVVRDHCLLDVSDDAGVNWAHRQLPPEACPDSFPKVPLVSGHDALYALPNFAFAGARSTDAGQTWKPAPLGGKYAIVPGPPADTLYAKPSSVQRSTDGGATWEITGDPPPPALGGASLLASVDDRLYLTIEGSVARSADAGRTWRRGHPSTPIPIALSPFDAAHAYSVWGGGFWSTEDGGVTWSFDRGFFLRMPRPEPGGSSGEANWLVLDPIDAATLYVGISGSSIVPPSGRAFRSLDGGRTWAGFPGGSLDNGLDAFALLRTTSAPNTFFATTASFFPFGAGWAIAKSTDGGRSWTLAYRGPTPGGPTPGPGPSLAASDVSADVIYARMGSNVIKTQDGGQNWTVVRQANDVARLIVHPRRPEILFVILYNPSNTELVPAIVRSNDGGATFQSVLSGPDVLSGPMAFDTTNPDSVFYAGALSLYRSSDAGVTWSSIALPQPANRFLPLEAATARSRPGVVFAVGAGNIYWHAADF